MTQQEEIKALKEEIERLKDLLRANGIPVPEKESANHLPFSQEPMGKKPQFASNHSFAHSKTSGRNFC